MSHAPQNTQNRGSMKPVEPLDHELNKTLWGRSEHLNTPKALLHKLAEFFVMELRASHNLCVNFSTRAFSLLHVFIKQRVDNPDIKKLVETYSENFINRVKGGTATGSGGMKLKSKEIKAIIRSLSASQLKGKALSFIKQSARAGKQRVAGRRTGKSGGGVKQKMSSSYKNSLPGAKGPSPGGV